MKFWNHAFIKVMRLWVTGFFILASNQNGEFVSIKELSEKLDISFHFLTKILQQLTAVDLLESHKGPKGGVRLSKPGNKISLLDIVCSY